MRKTFAAILGLLVGVAHAQTFQARDLNGDGTVDAYYQVERNLTWLADANYYATLGLPADTAVGGSNYPQGIPMPAGVLRWSHANTFVDGLSLGGVSDWRLPTRLVPEGSYSGSDWCPAQCVRETPNFGPEFQSEYSFVQGALGLFSNVASGVYMTASPGWYWEELRNLSGGGSYTITDATSLMAGNFMIVRTGDVGTAVTAVPEAGTYALMLCGLSVLALGRRRQRRSAQAPS